MAKQLKPDAGKPKGIPAEDVRRIISDFNRHKEHAADNSGLAGQTIKNAVERYGVDRGALTKVAALSRKESATAMSFIRHFLDLADKADLFAQADAFDDIVPILERVLHRVKNTQPPHGVPSSKDHAVDDLLDGGATIQ